MVLPFKFPLPPFLSNGQKYFRVLYILSKQILILSHFFSMRQKPWLWDTVRLSVSLFPVDGRWHLFGLRIILSHEISKLPLSFFKLIYN